MLDRLVGGMTILSPTGEALTVSETLAAEFEPGDSIVADAESGLLRIPARERQLVSDAVGACESAFDGMSSVGDEQIAAFFRNFADALSDDQVWQEIRTVNDSDVADAKSRGRSTTRLAVSEAMRQNMLEGLRGWATMSTRRGRVLDEIQRPGFRIQLVGDALGVVGFVFEGRPNVLVDACGVVRGGNTAILRIGRDALATARSIMDLVVRPALIEAGMPEHAIVLVDSAAHAAGWSLFLDSRLSLAVARGSGPAVRLLGSLARRTGTPVSLHGTGGAWIVASNNAAPEALDDAVRRSLDRKVCNTLNTLCIQRSAADRLVPVALRALKKAADARGQPFKLHVESGGMGYVPGELFENEVTIVRAEGPRSERQADPITVDDVGTEWEWEESPEVTLVVVDSLDDAIGLFNRYSPRLVASLVSDDSEEHARFWTDLRSPFVGDGFTRWVDGQFALGKPELGLSNWEQGRLFGHGAILTGNDVFTVRTRYVTSG